MDTQTKFFAIIDGERRGPFTLEELEGAGVGPDTYVWCKGMQKWRRARHVADVCRYWRQRLSGTHASQQPVAAPVVEHPSQTNDGKDTSDRIWLRSVRSFDPAEGEPGVDIEQPPRNLVVPAVLVTLLCMPLTGFVAIYFCARSRGLWARAVTGKDLSAEDVKRLKRESHDAVRSAKMWIGITFFLGVIAQGFMMRYVTQTI